MCVVVLGVFSIVVCFVCVGCLVVWFALRVLMLFFWGVLRVFSFVFVYCLFSFCVCCVVLFGIACVCVACFRVVYVWSVCMCCFFVCLLYCVFLVL